jgi:hypothetical protein
MPDALYSPWRFLVLISVRSEVDPRGPIVWLEGLFQLKNPVTSLGIAPATFCDSCINVLSLLLTTAGHFLLYCAHRESCTKFLSYCHGAAHLEELWLLFWAVELGLGSHVQRSALHGQGSWSLGMLPHRYRKWNLHFAWWDRCSGQGHEQWGDAHKCAMQWSEWGKLGDSAEGPNSITGCSGS